MSILTLIEEWREAGPVAWCEDSYGWLDVDGKPITLEAWQRAVLSAWWERRESVRTLAISNVKKTGKTFTNAVLTCWRFLCFPGEHFCAANDLDQSTSRQFAMIADMIRRHPLLRKHTRITGRQLIFVPTGSTLTALANDAAGNSGANHSTASHTEAWGIEYEASVRAWEELTPPPGFFYGLPPMRIADSYAGFEGQSATWHDVVDRGLSGEPVSDGWPIFQAGGLLLFHIEGEEAQERCYRGTPEQAAAYYADERESFKGRPGTFQRMHLNRRAAAEGNFVSLDDWQACISPHHSPLDPGSKKPVFVGLDIAVAAHGDDCAIAGVYPADDGKTALAFHKIWRGKDRTSQLKAEFTVIPFLLAIRSRYSLMGVWYDPSQSWTLTELLNKAGILTVPVQQTHSSRGPKDTALQQLVLDHRLILYDHDDIRNLSANAIVKELPNGLIFLQKASGRAKIDLLVALSNCASEAAQGTGEIEIIRVGDGPRRDFTLWGF